MQIDEKNRTLGEHTTKYYCIAEADKSMWTLCQDYQDTQDKQQTQYRLTSRSKWKTHQLLFEILKSECPDFWIRLLKHKWYNSWCSMEDPTVSFWAKSAQSSFDRSIMGQIIRERPFKILLGKKFRIGNTSSFIENRNILICVWERFEIDWKEQFLYKTNVKNTHETCWFGRTYIIPWPCLFDIVLNENIK